MKIHLAKKYNEIILQTAVATVFFIGLLIYIQQTVDGGIWSLSNAYPFQLQFEWFIGLVLLAMLIYYAHTRPIFIVRWLSQRKYSPVEIYIGLWLLTVVSSGIVILWLGIPSHELAQGFTSVVGKISSVFVAYLSFAILIYISGSALLTSCKVVATNKLCNVIISFGVGLMLLASFFYIASSFHLLNIGSVLLYIVLAFTIGWQHVASIGRFLVKRSFSYPELHFLSVLICLIAIAWFVILFLSIALPHPIGGDDLRTYYTIPKAFIEAGGNVQFPYFTFNNAPHIATYIYIPILLVSSFLLNYINIFAFILLLAALYSFASLLSNRRAGLWSMLFFAAAPLNYWFIITVKIDYLAVFFVLLSLLVLYQHHTTKQVRWIALSGLFIGTAIGIKYTVLLLLPFLLLLIALWPYPSQIKTNLKKVGIILVFIGLSISPWAIHNYITYQNVLYPLSFHSIASNIPGVERLDPTRHEQLMSRFSLIHKGYTHGLYPDDAWYQILENIFIGRSNYPHNAIGPWFFLLVPLLIFSFFKPQLRPLTLLSVGTFIVWFWMSPAQLWYVLYIFAFLAIIYGISTGYLSHRLKYAILITIVSFFILTMNTSRLEFARFLLPEYTSRVIMAMHQPADLIDYLNNVLKIEHPNYVLFSMTRGGVRGGYIEDSNKHVFQGIESFNRNDVFVGEWEPNQLLQEMRAAGITHILYSKQSDEYWENFYCPYDKEGRCFHGKVRENLTAIMQYLIPVYSNDDKIIYGVNYET